MHSTERSFEVRQHHFTSWPDHGVPEYATSMLSFHKRVISQHMYRTSKGPILVHCRYTNHYTWKSPCHLHFMHACMQCWYWTYWYLHLYWQCVGAGQECEGGGHCRSHQQDEAPAHEDGPDTSKLCLSHSCGLHNHTILIIHKEQYIFLHDAVLESVTCGDTEISSANLRLAVRKLNKINQADNTTMMQTQFKVNRHQSLITYTFMAAGMALSVGSGSDISKTKWSIMFSCSQESGQKSVWQISTWQV